jgi:hypothetical protein
MATGDASEKWLVSQHSLPADDFKFKILAHRGTLPASIAFLLINGYCCRIFCSAGWNRHGNWNEWYIQDSEKVLKISKVLRWLYLNIPDYFPEIFNFIRRNLDSGNILNGKDGCSSGNPLYWHLSMLIALFLFIQ